MTPLAHTGHWLESAVYLLPIVVFALWLLVSLLRDRGGDAVASDPEVNDLPGGAWGLDAHGTIRTRSDR